MTHDIVVRGGLIVDGTGSEPVAADLAIDDGLITTVGTVDGEGKQEIDASGLTVTPGFIDIHTHLDAQIGWDPELTPVSWHGVTTALLGNCGVTFAPCKPSDRDLLASMMETVEDIPKQAILEGLPWDWEGYGGYLDSIEKLRPGINVAGLVGHCAVRYYVMGERAVEEQASADEKRQMAELVAESIDAGAIGFSTNRYDQHKLPDGRAIPGTFANVDELVEIAKQVGPRGALMQAVGASPEVLDELASQSRVLFSAGAGTEKGNGRLRADWLDGLNTDGREVTATTQVRGSGYLCGLQSNLPVAGETWEKLRAMKFEARLEAIRDADMCTKLVAEARLPNSTWIALGSVFYLGGGVSPDYTSEQSILALAKAAGEHWSETFLRLSREDQGRGFFNLRMFNSNLDELRDFMKSECLIPGLGDAGAHVSQIMDAGWSSFMLSYWVRESGYYSMAEAIKLMTSRSAKVIGLKDRGTLAPGMRADVNVFDAATVAEQQPQLVHDFPGGAPRYIQRAIGYKATLVNGQINVLDGKHTGARAGSVLRHNQ